MKILAVQNRMGIGDTVIFLPFIKAVSKKFNTPISLLIKESSKAHQFLHQTDYIDKILILERDNKTNNRHGGFFGIFNLAKDLKKHNFDKIFIFNSSLRFNLIAKISGIPKIYQYPLFTKTKQHITEVPKRFLKTNLDLDVDEDPEVQIDNDLISKAVQKFQIDKNKTNILLGIGGSGPTKRIPAKTFLSVIDKISSIKSCNFFLATGKANEEQEILNIILQSKFKNFCTRLDDLPISEILPLIKSCNVSICNDSSFSHLSSALGIKTITLMADTPLIYGNYSTKMFPIIPDGEKTVSHNTLGKEKIDPQKIFEKFIEIID
ncbi:glycosyltransferase family 9 protein [Candidatus Pelagibacter communis]|uniref:glycosyltransferase family 9 protein n=1 Tax=Pelagibacter ubique TaxID=198252 RepID=UPI00094D67BB|nr:glycosyltransferase family 9 protein [Candidatus Pelagibacter ubique]